jgi:hypothetical protein
METRKVQEETQKNINYISNKTSKPSKDLKPIIKYKNSKSQLKGVNLIINNSIDSHMLTNSFNLKSTAAIKSDNNPSKKLQKLKQKEANDTRKSQCTQAVYLGHDNEQKINEEEEANSFKIPPQPPTSKSFKLPTILINGQHSNQSQYSSNYENVYYTATNQNVPLSIQPIILNQASSASATSPLYGSVRLNKKSGKFNELKVFAQETIENQLIKPAPNQQQQQQQTTDTTISSSNSNEMKSNEFKLITNSTPLFNDTNNAAELHSRRKQFLNAQLNLTIAPPPVTANQAIFAVPKIPTPVNQDKTINNAPKPPPFSSSTPMVNSNQLNYNYHHQQAAEANGNRFFKMSSLKPNKSKQNLATATHENIKEEEFEPTQQQQQQLQKKFDVCDQLMPSIGGTQVTGSLNLSRISAITSDTNLVNVVKTEIPKELKKCMKEELKKDKKNCVIQ